MGKTYKRPFKITLPKLSRTLPIFGKGDDDGKYFHCWNCGFVCDSQRDKLGDSDSEAGDNHTDYLKVANEDGAQVCLGGSIGHYHVAAKLGPDSTPLTVFHALKSDISFGCPFCGSTNWRGDY